MKTEMVGMGRVILIFVFVFGCGFAQQAAPDKSARDIEKEQTRKVIAASPLCQRAMTHPETESMHKYPIDHSTLAPNLTALMDRSDDVILTTIASRAVAAIAPSGDDIIEYEDVKVLRTWKGLFKPGDTVTFTFTYTSVPCSLGRSGDSPRFSTLTGADVFRWSGINEAYVLFLRRAQGTERQLTPGLRMTGGSGMQGIYPVQFPSSLSPLVKESHCQNDYSRDKYPEDPKLCLEFLENSDLPISIPLSIDPLSKKYEGMRVSDFLREIQDVADSQEDVPPTGESK
jgi:hypothetical protein